MRKFFKFLVFVGLIVGCSSSEPAATPSTETTTSTTALVEINAALPYAADQYAAVYNEAVGLWNATVSWNEAEAENEARETAAANQVQSTTNNSPSQPVNANYTGMGPCQYNYPEGWGPGTCNGYACGGTLPPCCVMAGESGGNPYAENKTSSASGLWQFIDSTWNGFGGYSHASYAPTSVQQDKAASLFAGGAGASHWNATIGCAG